MSAIVIDTNVLMVANEDSPPEQADLACVRACIDRLLSIQKGGSGETVVLDQSGLLLSEYRDTLKSSRQPSTGHAFLHWLFQVGWDPARCDQVKISCTDEDEQHYEEFPDHQGLASFDVSDRKFVATANAHPSKPSILQAVDAKRMGWETALNECGLEIEWICPDNAERLYADHLKSSS
jgi:hypothetical protein